MVYLQFYPLIKMAEGQYVLQRAVDSNPLPLHHKENSPKAPLHAHSMRELVVPLNQLRLEDGRCTSLGWRQLPPVTWVFCKGFFD